MQLRKVLGVASVKRHGCVARVMCRQRWVLSRVQLSSECRSLLDRIFVADVKQRITVEGIMQHPWYLHPLPSHYQSQLQHLDQVQAQKDAHIQSRRIDPVTAAVTPLGIPLGTARVL